MKEYDYVPEKIYVHRSKHIKKLCASAAQGKGDIEYVRADDFIEKARKWFEMQNEGVDSDGNYKCDMIDFEDFRNYMKGE